MDLFYKRDIRRLMMNFLTCKRKDMENRHVNGRISKACHHHHHHHHNQPLPKKYKYVRPKHVQHWHPLQGKQEEECEDHYKALEQLVQKRTEEINLLLAGHSDKNIGRRKTRVFGSRSTTRNEQDEHGAVEPPPPQTDLPRPAQNLKPNLNWNVKDLLDDYFPTTDTYTAFDSGRRGIMLDFDLLINNSATRRKYAFEQATREYMKLAATDQVDWVHDWIDDVSDENAVCRIIQTLYSKLQMQVPKAQDLDKLASTFMDILDKVFMNQEEKPSLNISMMDVLKHTHVKSNTRIILLHKGSRIRLEAELKALGIGNTFVARNRCTMDFQATAPYLPTILEMAARIKVPVHQCFVMCKGRSDPRQVPNLVVAASILNCQSILVDNENCMANYTFSVSNDKKDEDHDPALILDEILKSPPLSFKERSDDKLVLAQQSVDMLWYVARIELEIEVNQTCWVQFLRWKNWALVAPNQTKPLTDEMHSNLKRNGYAGIHMYDQN